MEPDSPGLPDRHSKIIDRILAQTGSPRLLSILADDLAPADLKSLLMAAYQARSEKTREPEVLARFERNQLFATSSVDARLLNRFDRVAFAQAADFEAVELSPVCPLGTNAAVSHIDQNNVLTTIRNAEVLGDPTVAMALECAPRRRNAKQRAGAVTRLCTSQRVVRLQPFDFPGFTPHFRLFGLVSAGRDTGSSQFEMQSLGEHVRFYLNLFRALNGEGFSFGAPEVEVADLSFTAELLEAAGISREEVRSRVRAHEPGSAERYLRVTGLALPQPVENPRAAGDAPRLGLLEDQVFAPLRAAYPEARFSFHPDRLQGLEYYSGLCLRIAPRTADGERHAIIDGGFTNWTARLLQDNKERLLTSGIGSEFACKRYIAPNAA